MARSTDTFALADFDSHGAVGAALERLPTRARFLRGAAGGATVFGALVLRPVVAAAQTSSGDIAILNFALTLEYLQAAFYSEAERIGKLQGPLAEQASVVGAHERAHVAGFQAALGSSAVKEPSFNFHGVTEQPDSFRATAVAFEDLAVAAYKEQLPKIQSPKYLATAVAIHSVEARHAAWIRRLANVVPAEHAFDDPLPNSKTVEIVNSTHFVTLQTPQTSAERRPGFTG
ncbi:MAG: ferritin-like domain-containing protein [Solirubrobacterales bacterium]|nr:ferritin-like domain-containing protein [Solirubrobacterales bacterium]